MLCRGEPRRVALVNGVVDGIKVVRLCHLGKIKLAGASAVLSGNAGFQILLGGVGQALTQHLCKLCGVPCSNA